MWDNMLGASWYRVAAELVVSFVNLLIDKLMRSTVCWLCTMLGHARQLKPTCNTCHKQSKPSHQSHHPVSVAVIGCSR